MEAAWVGIAVGFVAIVVGCYYLWRATGRRTQVMLMLGTTLYTLGFIVMLSFVSVGFSNKQHKAQQEHWERVETILTEIRDSLATENR